MVYLSKKKHVCLISQTRISQCLGSYFTINLSLISKCPFVLWPKGRCIDVSHLGYSSMPESSYTRVSQCLGSYFIIISFSLSDSHLTLWRFFHEYLYSAEITRLERITRSKNRAHRDTYLPTHYYFSISNYHGYHYSPTIFNLGYKQTWGILLSIFHLIVTPNIRMRQRNTIIQWKGTERSH